MIKGRVICFLGFHNWTEWEYHSGGRNSVWRLDKRVCTRCGKVERNSPYAHLID